MADYSDDNFDDEDFDLSPQQESGKASRLNQGAQPGGSG